jgi:hypothetical protein
VDALEAVKSRVNDAHHQLNVIFRFEPARDAEPEDAEPEEPEESEAPPEPEPATELMRQIPFRKGEADDD